MQSTNTVVSPGMRTGMNFDSDTDDMLKCDGLDTSLTPSIALLYRKIGTSPAPRMLEQAEIDLLRKSKEEVFKVTRKEIGKVALAEIPEPH